MAHVSKPMPALDPACCKGCGRCIEACVHGCIAPGTAIHPASGLVPVTLDLASAPPAPSASRPAPSRTR